MKGKLEVDGRMLGREEKKIEKVDERREKEQVGNAEGKEAKER